MDPLYKPYLTPYNSYSNNPIIMVDPTGAADYYNQKGEKIGSDGNANDNTIIAVWNKDVERDINEATSKGMTIILPPQKEGVLRISPKLGNAMISAVERSNAPNKDVGDENGGWHEEGFVAGVVDGEEIIVPSAPGQVIKPEDTHGEIKLWKAADEAQQGLVTPENATIDVHIHVRGDKSSFLEPGGGHKFFDKRKIPVNDPSERDINIYRTSMETISYKAFSAVLSAKNGSLYLYNGQGTYATFDKMLSILQAQKAAEEQKKK